MYGRSQRATAQQYNHTVLTQWRVYALKCISQLLVTYDVEGDVGKQLLSKQYSQSIAVYDVEGDVGL